MPDTRLRYHSVHLGVMFLFGVLAVRLFILHVADRPFLLERARRQQRLFIEIPAVRGKILDRRGRELAVSIAQPSIYAVPRSVPPSERERLARELAKTFKVSEKDMRERLSRDKLFVWVKRKASFQEAALAEKFAKGTVGVIMEKERVYPFGETASSILGLCDIDGRGLEGLEAQYERDLKGEQGYRQLMRDGRGRPLFGRDEKSVPPRDGNDLQITIDLFIQHLFERELKRAHEQWKAKGAWGVVLDPRDGSVLAMATVPGHDPQARASLPKGALRNRAVVDFYEPGSVFKVVTAAAALEEKKVALTDTFNCENGAYRRGKFILHDVHPYGMLDVPSVFIKSSNIGTVKIAEKIGAKTLHAYARRFGFGEATGIDFPGEVSGFLRPVAKWSKTSIAAIPIGQEVTVTPLQLARAYAAVANGGTLVKPHLISRVIDPQGQEVRTWLAPAEPRAVISPEVAAVLRDILRRAVEEGTGQRALVEGIPVGGKTGTAQKLQDDPRKGYSHSKFVSSFVGMAPAGSPILVMVVMVDEPQGAYYGGTVAAPVFSAVVREALPYLGYLFLQGESETSEAVIARGALPGAPQTLPPALKPVVAQAQPVPAAPPGSSH